MSSSQLGKLSWLLDNLIPNTSTHTTTMNTTKGNNLTGSKHFKQSFQLFFFTPTAILHHVIFSPANTVSKQYYTELISCMLVSPRHKPLSIVLHLLHLFKSVPSCPVHSLTARIKQYLHPFTLLNWQCPEMNAFEWDVA